MLIIIIVFLFLTVGSAKKESLTFDEIFNLQEGTTNITTRTFPIEPYNPPFVREIAVLPSVLGFTPLSGIPNQIYFLNRMIIVVMAVILLWQVMRTAHEYFGFWSSLLSGILLALEPTFLAHSHYITPDIGLTLFTFMAYKAFLNVLISPTLTRYFFFGIFFGLACASKISAIPFLLLSTVIIFILKRKTFPMEWHMDHFGSILFALVVAVFVIWTTYFFRFTPILVKHDNPERLSNKILAYANQRQLAVVSQGIQLLQGTPVPLGDYIGLLKNNLLRAQTPQRTFYAGTFHSNVSWYMTFDLLLKKLTLPFVFFLFAGIFLLITPEKILKYLITIEDRWKKNITEQEMLKKDEKKTMDEYQNVPRYKIRVQYEERMDKEWNYLFIVPIFSIFVVTIVTGMGPLIRYILPVFPFLAIVAGSSIQSLRSQWKKVLIVLCLFWYGYITLQAYPHFISYANEFIPQEKRYQYFIDSNLDWGQGLISLQTDYLSHRPSTLFLSYFGRDDAAMYGFSSNLLWGSYKNDEICAFHTIRNEAYTSGQETAISVSNWYNCGYYLQPEFSESNIKRVVEDAILIF